MILIILSVLVLVFSAVIHEYAHGWMAFRLGDDTAKKEGRLTLNPLVHLDWFGSIILPLLFIITKANFFLAWAKPVPYNPYNLRDKKYGELKVALAGPASNILLALFFGLVARFLPLAEGVRESLIINFFQGDSSAVFSLTAGSLNASLSLLAMVICFMNFALAIFNLMPVPPLDGSKILVALLPASARELFWKIERYGFIVLLALIMLGAFRFVSIAVFWLFSLVTGVS